jgi:hypothetical protein
MLKLIVSVLLFSFLAFHQTEGQDKLAPEEMRDAIKLARAFDEEMTLRNDVNSLAEKFFLDTFIDRQLGNDAFYGIPNVKREIAINIDRKQLRAYYFSLLNFEYLATVYYLNKFDLERLNEDAPWQANYPSEAVDLVKSIYPDGVIRGAPNRIQNETDLRRYVRVQNQISKIIRAKIKKNSLIYERNIAGLNKSPHHSAYKPWDAGDSGAFGLAGTRMIFINTLMYQLLLVHTENGLRIGNVGPE